MENNNDNWLVMGIMDKKMGRFDRPFCVKHAIEATRSLQQHLKKGESMISQYPSDYALYLLGTFDPVSGEISSGRPEHILEVSSLSPLTGEGVKNG